MGTGNIFRIVGATSGLAGLAVGMIVILFKEVIRKRIFPMLPKREAYGLLRLVLVLSWSIAVVGIGAWTYVQWLSQRQLSGAPQATEKAAVAAALVIAGTVVDRDTNAGIGQASIAIAGSKDVITSEDSGNFRIQLPPGLARGERQRLSVSKAGYQQLDTSVLPPTENLTLLLRKK